MDLRQLRYFVRIAETGSFSRASQSLNVAQPSLSQQIRNLEDELGVALFLRHARGVNLNPHAQEFFGQARRILASVEAARQSIQRTSGARLDRVSLGLPSCAIEGLFSPLRRKLSIHEPELVLHLVEDDRERLTEAVDAGRLDVALLHTARATRQRTDVDVMTEDLVLVSAAGTGIPGAIDFSDLARKPIVLPSRGHLVRTVIDDLATECAIDLDVMTCDSLSATLQLVAEEGHRAIVPLSDVPRRAFGTDLDAVHIVAPSPTWRMTIAISKEAACPRASGAVAQWLATVIAEETENGRWPVRRPHVRALETPTCEGLAPAQTG